MSASGKKGSGTLGGSGRQPKGHPPSGDFFALGSKSAPGGPRQASPAGGPPPKKLHLEEESTTSGGDLFSNPIRISSQSRMVGGASDVTMTSSPKSLQIIEVRPSELVQAVNEAIEAHNPPKVTKLLLGSLKQLKNARLKVDTKLNEALVSLGREKPEIFNNQAVIESLLSVLKRETGAIFKTRSEPLTYTLASVLLLLALKDSNDWPEGVAKTYIDDALGDRVWVDFKSCKKLTDNVLTLFNSRHIDSLDTQQQQSESMNEPSEDMFSSLIESIPVQPRFSQSTCHSLRSHVVQMVKDQLGKRSGLQPSSDVLLKANIKFLMTAVGLSEIRLFIVEKFEQWVQNSKMVKPVHDLLLAVAANCHQRTPENIKVLETLLNAKLKTRFFSQQYISCIKEFISVHSDNLSIVLHRVVSNELSQPVRQPTNIQLLTVVCQQWPDESVKILATVFQDFLCRKEDYHRALRSFLREMVRRCENFSLGVFARSLMQQRTEHEFNNLEQAHKERMAISLADLISCTCMLTVSATIRESYTNYTKGDKGSISLLKSFYDTLGIIQRDGVWWVHSILPNFLRPQPTDYKACLRKVLFLEPHESYYSKDNWPSENDRNLIFQLMTEGYLNGDTLMRILVIGLDKDLPLSPSDALDITDKLVARAANIHTTDIPRVPLIERRELFNAIFDITTYRPPSSIMLPKSYKPPDLAISKLYWKGWLLLLVLSAFNPKTIGAIGWDEYPTLQAMMIMVMTNDYTFPVSLAETQKELLTLQEEELTHEEKEVILKYENYLATSSSSSNNNNDNTITESSSYLLNQVMLLDPKGPARRLPTSVVELIKTVNSSLRLGQLLCHCREPDFLLKIIQQQGTSQAMSWLRDLIDGSHSSLDVLPVPCLCEFLITSYQEKKSFKKPLQDTAAAGDSDTSSSHRSSFKRKQRSKEKIIYQHEQMIKRLQSLVDTTPSSCLDVLQYFINKLTAPSHSVWALKALQDILTLHVSLENNQKEKEDKNNSSWLLQSIPSLSVFPSISPSLVKYILSASHTELNVSLFVSFIKFITLYAPQDDTAIIIDIGVLIAKRFTFFKKAFSHTVGESSINILLSILDMFYKALDAHVHQDFQPPSAYKDEDLTILSLPSISEICEVLVVSEFLDAVFLVLSLLPSSHIKDSTRLFSMLLPSSDENKRAQVLAMATREPQQLVKDEIFEETFLNCNGHLLSRLVRFLEPHQIRKCLSMYGVPKVNMDLLLEVLDSVHIETRPIIRGIGEDKVSSLIRIQHLRGCTKGHLFLYRLTKETSSIINNDDKTISPDKGMSSHSLSVEDMETDPHVDTNSAQNDLSLTINEVLSSVLSIAVPEPLIVQRLFSFLLNLWIKPSQSQSSQFLDYFLILLEQLSSSSRTLGQLETIFKRPYIWRLFYILTNFINKRHPLLIDTYLKHLSSLKNLTVTTGKANTVKQVITSCISILDTARTPSSVTHLSLTHSSPKKIANLLLQSGGHYLEDALLAYVKECILNGRNELLIDVLIKLKIKSATVYGILCDLMQIIDPELLSISPKLIHEFLFSSHDTVILLEELLHQVSLSTLRESILKALSISPESDFNSPVLLELVWASLHLPTLWQGKLKKEAIIDSNLSLGIEESHQLSLSNAHLFSLIDHIMKELSKQVSSSNSISSSDMISRLPLLITCSKGRSSLVAKYIKEHSSIYSNQLLMCYYHGDVSVGTYVTHSFDVSSSLPLPSTMDSYLHYLLVSMTCVSNNSGEQNIQKLTAASLLCRCIALTHPLILLRQLPLLGSLLKGCTGKSKHLKTQSQIIYTNSFHLLHLLQPLVFDKSFNLESCLESFMIYLKYECVNGSLSQSFLGKVLSFLNQYSQISHERAQKFLVNHFDTLQSIKDAFPKHKKLIQDIIGSLPSSTSKVTLSDPTFSRVTSSRDRDTPPGLTFQQGHSYSQVLPFVRKLEFSQTQDEMLQVLKDLEDSSLRSIEILHHFIPILCQIIQSPADTSCSRIAHEILLRHLRHKPSSLSDVLPSLLSCLNSSNSSVVMTTVPFLPEIILLSPAQEASLLMFNLFQFAVISPNNCSQELKRVLTLLTSHTAV